jgi:predicted metalloendopeptidase
MKKLRWVLLLLSFVALPAFAQKARVHDYSTRLASLLQDAQSNAMLTPATWKAVANEANALANKLYAASVINAKARKLAGDARAHVRELHKAAMKGDADGAKAHAGMALPFVYQLIDWSAPPK